MGLAFGGVPCPCSAVYAWQAQQPSAQSAPSPPHAQALGLCSSLQLHVNWSRMSVARARRRLAWRADLMPLMIANSAYRIACLARR